VCVVVTGAEGIGADDTSRRLVALLDTGVKAGEVPPGAYVEAATLPAGIGDEVGGELPPVALALEVEVEVEDVEEDVVSSIQTAIGSSPSSGPELGVSDASANNPLLPLVSAPIAESEDVDGSDVSGVFVTWRLSTDDEIEPSVPLLEGKEDGSLLVMTMAGLICPLALSDIDPADGTVVVGLGNSPPTSFEPILPLELETHEMNSPADKLSDPPALSELASFVVAGMVESISVKIDPEVDDTDPAIGPEPTDEDSNEPHPDEDVILLGISVGNSS